MQPLLEAGTPVLPSSVRDVVWIIIERSTSSKCPRRSSSGLPPRNSSLPLRACDTRHSMSPYSSAGTAKNTTRPASWSKALASSSPMAAPSRPATWALWPQAWAAPVWGSATGWPVTTSASSSPSRANVGPEPARPATSARTPVSANPLFGERPRRPNVSSTSRAVLTSLKPSSGFLPICSPRPTISSARLSMASYTRCFSSFLVMAAPPRAILPAMDYHHVIEAAGVISLGMIAFSYLVRWFADGDARRRRWRPVVNGLVFGLLAVFLMRFRIYLGGDRFVDTRVIPIALATLIEGPITGAVTAALAVVYRVWLGGSGAVAGVVGIVGTAVAAAGVRAWAQRDGGLRLRHGSVLVLAVWGITAASFLVLGARGLAMFEPVWLPLLAMTAVGLGVGARLFHDVVAGQAD